MRFTTQLRALALLKKYIDVSSTQVHFALTEDIPLDGAVQGIWRAAVVRQNGKSQTEHVNRISQTLPTVLRRSAKRNPEVFQASEASMPSKVRQYPNEEEAKARMSQEHSAMKMVFLWGKQYW